MPFDLLNWFWFFWNRWKITLHRATTRDCPYYCNSEVRTPFVCVGIMMNPAFAGLRGGTNFQNAVLRWEWPKKC